MDLERERSEHPSYGMIGISRVSGRLDNMFGSDVPHSAWLELSIGEAVMDRHLHSEWYHKKKNIVKIQLSHSQFSEMVSSMNCGDGVPCTIIRRDGHDRIERPPMLNRVDQFKQEFTNELKDIANRMNDCIEQMEKLKNKTGATKKEKEAILSELKMVRQDIDANLPFVEKSFVRCMNSAVDDAKRNIEGHVLNKALNSAERGLVTNQESQDLIENQSTLSLGG